MSYKNQTNDIAKVGRGGTDWIRRRILKNGSPSYCSPSKKTLQTVQFSLYPNTIAEASRLLGRHNGRKVNGKNKHKKVLPVIH